MKKAVRNVTVALALALTLAVAVSAITPAATAQQRIQENLTVKLYPDNSARLVGYVIISGHPPVRGVAGLNITQGSNSSEAILYVNMTAVNASKSIPKTSSPTKQAEVEELLKNLKLRAYGNSTIINSKYVGSVKLNFNLLVNLGSDGNKLKLRVVTLKPLKILKYVKNATMVYDGVIKVEYSGSNTAAFALMFSLLNKKYIESKLRQSNVTWVEIRELNTTTTPSSSVIRFSVLVNESNMVKAIAKKNATLASKLEKLIRTPLIPLKAYLTFTMRLGDGKVFAEVRMKSNLPIAKMIEALINNTLNNMKQLSIKGPSAPTAPQVGGRNFNPKKAMALIANISKILEKFEILPSSGFIRVKAGSNGVTITFQTLKFRAKGAKSAKDTLRELVNSVKELREMLGKHVSSGGKGTSAEAVKALDAVLKGNVSVMEVNSTAPPKVLPFEELSNYTPSNAATTTATSSKTSTTTASTTRVTSTTSTASTASTTAATSTTATKTATASAATTTATTPTPTTSMTPTTSSESTTTETAAATTTSSSAASTTTSSAPATHAKPSSTQTSTTAKKASWGAAQIALVAGVAIGVAVVTSVVAAYVRRRRV